MADREEYLKAASEALEAEKKKGEPKVVSAGEPEVSLTEAPPAPEKDPEELKGLVAGIKRREMLKRYKDQAEIASWSPNPIMQTAGDIGYLGTSAAQYAEGEVDWTDPAIGAAAVAFPGGIGLIRQMKRKFFGGVDPLGNVIKGHAGQTYQLPKVDERFYKWFGKSHVSNPRTSQPIRMYHGSRGLRAGEQYATLRPNRGAFGTGVYFTPQPKLASGTYAGGNTFRHGTGGSVVPAFISLQNPVYYRDPLPDSLSVAIRKNLEDAGYAIENVFPPHTRVGRALAASSGKGSQGLGKGLSLEDIMESWMTAKGEVSEKLGKDLYKKHHDKFYAIKDIIHKAPVEAGHDGLIKASKKDWLSHAQDNFSRPGSSKMYAVVYEPNSIKSAITNTGEYSRGTGSMIKGAAATVGAGAAGRSLREDEEGE